jgi:N-methylhydantoinase A
MTPDDIAIGVDVGGTFTDVVCRIGNDELRILKVPTTRPEPSGGIRDGLTKIAGDDPTFLGRVKQFAHGTTVATNAVLERKGARTGLLVTEGFRDILEIGRSFRPNMYDVFVESGTPHFLAPRARRIGVRERIGPDGAVLEPLDEASARDAIRQLLDQDVETIAIAFLFSFINPAHELAVRELVRDIAPQMHVSLSHEVDPAFREFERTCITAFDAYVKPKLSRYLSDVGADLVAVGVPAPLQVMQSRGGLSGGEVAAQRPVRLFLSGPAGGVVGARACGTSVGEDDLITFDVGGTSCDIALIQKGVPLVKPTSSLDGFVVRVPMVDVNAIGAGGGSIAWIDAAGGLRVGPHSAGSEPGPACYGRGGSSATVTDASVVLGYINPAYFAGGALNLSPELAHRAVKDTIADPLGMSVEAAALGIHRVVTAQMGEGIRLVSVKRGIDPRRFTLVPLGGGGGIHAIPLARSLGIGRVLVPRYPGVLAACGLLVAPVQHEVATSLQRPLAGVTLADLDARFAGLVARCQALMAQERVAWSDVAITFSADLCYVGQSHFLEVPVDLAALRDGAGDVAALAASFYESHNRTYGHGEPGPVRVVNLRAVASVEASWSLDAIQYHPRPGGRDAATRAVLFEEHPVPLPARILERQSLALGDVIAGPAVLEQSDTTTLVEPGWMARVVTGGNLILEQMTA